MKRHAWLTVIILFGLLIIQACVPDETIDPQVEAKIEEFSRTATARATMVNQAEEAALSVQRDATATAVSLEQTKTALSMENDVFAQATQTAAGPVLAELPLYGINPEQGAVLWLHPPVTLRAEGYRGNDCANEFPQITAADFVLSADITWDSQYGNSGCGFIFRSDGEPDFGNHYMLIASRGAQGHVYFFAMANGEPANFKNIYANGLDPNFEWEGGTTNRLTVVARGDVLEVYSNYTYIGSINTSLAPDKKPTFPPPPTRPERPDGPVTEAVQARYDEQLAEYQRQLEAYQAYVAELDEQYADAVRGFQLYDTHFEEGFVGFLAFTYTGWTECSFENAWLWGIDSE